MCFHWLKLVTCLTPCQQLVTYKSRGGHSSCTYHYNSKQWPPRNLQKRKCSPEMYDVEWMSSPRRLKKWCASCVPLHSSLDRGNIHNRRWQNHWCDTRCDGEDSSKCFEHSSKSRITNYRTVPSKAASQTG